MLFVVLLGVAGCGVWCQKGTGTSHSPLGLTSQPLVPEPVLHEHCFFA